MKFDSQNPHNASQLHAKPVLGNPVTSFDIQGHQAYTQHADSRHTFRQNIHMHNIITNLAILKGEHKQEEEGCSGVWKEVTEMCMSERHYLYE